MQQLNPALVGENQRPGRSAAAVPDADFGRLGQHASVEEIGFALASRHPQAIQACYDKLGPLVIGYVRRRYPRLDADDVLQATMVELWRVAERFDPKRSLEAWVLHIASRRALDFTRREQRHEWPSLEVVGELGSIDKCFADRVSDAEVLRQALSSLNDGQRTVIELSYVHEMTQAEIARALDIPLGTVKARTFRGLKALRAELGRLGLL